MLNIRPRVAALLPLALAATLAAGLHAAQAQFLPPAPGPAPAYVPLLTAKDPSAIVAALQDLGYSAALDKDSDGDPMITGKASKSSYTVYFYGCTKNIDCTHIQFFVKWPLGKTIKDTLIADWNRDELWGQAYRSSNGGDPVLSFPINLEGGVSSANFTSSVAHWRELLEDFEDKINWKG